MDTLCLVSCVSKKRPVICEAQYLYQSAWFKLASEYAKRFDAWAILSAKHGLLRPDEMVAPYDDFMGNKTSAQRKEWSALVAAQIEQAYPCVAYIQILAGKAYRADLVPLLEATVEVPMEGLGIGQQLQWLKAR